jgi:hypothetical protein
MWAIGPDFHFNDAMVEMFSDFDEANDAAFDWSVEMNGQPVFIWRMTTGNPIKWMKVFA